MQKIIVIGCPGSGKTTFAEKLNEKVGFNLFYLDAIWHKPDRTHISREDFDARLGEILALDRWIIDGNYSRTLERRIEACDTVIWFDLPTEVCLEGVRERRGKPRIDMPWVETEEDPEFIELIKKYNDEQRPKVLSLLEKYRSGREIIVFRSRREADELLAVIN